MRWERFLGWVADRGSAYRLLPSSCAESFQPRPGGATAFMLQGITGFPGHFGASKALDEAQSEVDARRDAACRDDLAIVHNSLASPLDASVVQSG